MERFKRGRDGESRALGYLERVCGYRCLSRNYRWKRGEADLICEDPRGAVVLVEVRSSAERSLWLRHTVGPRKLRRLIATLELFIRRHPALRGRPRRVELAWVEGERVEHWKNPL